MLPLLTGALAAPVADHCVFMHGLGVDGKTEDAFFLGVAYWRELKRHASELCNHTHYPIIDTVTRGSANHSLQDDYYAIASAHQGPNDRVFAHSMGNVILGRACTDQGKCLARGWFAAHGPFTGSVVANLAYDWCPPRGNGTLPPELAGWVIQLVGYCSKATYSMAACGQPESEGICSEAQLATVGRMTRHGVMCGTSGWGLTSAVSPILGTLDDAFIAPRHGAPDDGMVSLSSCTAAIDAWGRAAKQNVSFGEEPSSRFYRAATNHADGMAFAGDGDFGNDRKPLTWFEDMIRLGWQA